MSAKNVRSNLVRMGPQNIDLEKTQGLGASGRKAQALSGARRGDLVTAWPHAISGMHHYTRPPGPKREGKKAGKQTGNMGRGKKNERETGNTHRNSSTLVARHESGRGKEEAKSRWAGRACATLKR